MAPPPEEGGEGERKKQLESSVPLGEAEAMKKRLIHKVFLSEGALGQAYLLTDESRVGGEEGGGVKVVRACAPAPNTVRPGFSIEV